MRCVHGQSGPALPAVLAAAAVLTALTASPAEARRRVHHGGGGGYNPPYAAMVVDAKTGRVMHAVNEDALRHPASITKVMTLYLLFEQLERGKMDLDSPLQISANAARQAPSKLGLRPGSTITVEEGIKALVTKSANDVACAIGENIAGSEPAFAEMMTRKAHALGMTRTHYANASGLPDADQITTARDLTILARAIQDRFPKYYRYFQTRSFAFRGRVIGNHNHLVGRVEGVDGIKTGYTRDSGFNLMTSARIGDRHIVAVVLGGKSVASRDTIMTKLVRANLPVAYAGARTAPPVVEVAERPRPAVVAERPVATRTLVASADEDDAVETTNSTGQPLDIAPRGGATPQGSAKWRSAAAAVPASAQAYAPAAAPAFPAPGGKYASRLPSSEPGEARAPAPREAVAPAAKPVTVSPWVIQLGAMDDEGKAKSMLAEARQRSGGALGKAAPFTEKVTHGGTTLYRARFSGFSEAETAQDACRALKRNGFTCFATRS
ncbi:D-alanyl-D-alanine carboxypeptidase [Methylobacterium platani]|uniref:D-alanyl-D-alanine carboxypeptidase n=2 Tax=Methylobacterium platani TaxID=427683 RepID=A0A179SJR6_9HYPH|nr:D-alanyl-D-alanine carboxypeptidase [Methylobacterium platani]KMO18577.1 D-Ala-D-Ala carboxypeptidase [Methylobacterium platani JCM 14648]OAS26813.1 D-alanyl-D-alanine carboxypeptidase [Methylobacterium platani]